MDRKTVPILRRETSKARHIQEQERLWAGQTNREEQEAALSRLGRSRLATTPKSSYLYIVHTPFSLTLPHTANAFAALEVEEATPIQPARRLDAQSELQLKEPTKSGARTNGTSKKKSRSHKKASADAPSSTNELFEKRETRDGLSAKWELSDGLSAKREPTVGLTARRKSTNELSARREPPTCAAQKLLSFRKGCWPDYAIPGGHKAQHQSGKQTDFQQITQAH